LAIDYNRRFTPVRAFPLYCATLLLALVLGCKGQDESRAEYAYVSNPQVTLRDRVAAVYNKVGIVNSGEKVRVLDRSQNKRFVKVRAEDGREGWMEQRYLVDQVVYDGFARLAKENANTPAQATASARRAVNLHVDPARNAASIYQVKENVKVQLLKRTSTPKSGLKKGVEEPNQSKDEEESGKAAVPNSPPDPLEDWWLVRDDQQHTGWVLGRMLDVEIPLEIAQYAEGQRIIAAFVLNEVPETKESDKKVPQYAVLMTEPKDGLPFDYNQVRIFTWNPNRTRYETAYRERFPGKLPFTVGKEDFGKEGVLPTFTARAFSDNGQVTERKYKLNGPIVRRVLAPGETQNTVARKSRK
jgi:SH3-like domain-containing protein